MFERFKENRKELREREIRDTAERLYQVAENDGELWLTYSSQVVIPQSMLNEDILEVVKRLRERYISKVWTEV